MYEYFKLTFELAWQKKHYLAKTLTEPIDLMQGSATFNVKRAILAPFPPNKIHVEPQNIWCPNKDNTAYS